MSIETKDMAFDLKAAGSDGAIEGYASLFGEVDQGGDIVAPGAYAASLSKLAAQGRKVKMLWQHDPSHPIGVWEELREDDRGLWVKGRILTEVEKGREAVALIKAGSIDGLSIGYRTISAQKDDGGNRVLQEVDLWEVSLVTFPMLPTARVASKGDVPSDLIDKLKAGARLTEREFEATVKGLGLSNSQAERAARVHLKGQGDPAVAETDARVFLTTLMGF
ncbi:HK97 family phage prohead protease [Phaeobacter inhibens]|nr:putative phage prohead protease [Phaeobacter inhibens DSM 17395]AUQ46599.1 putative phage prohead protease [Phaeobacter inhibens]AXT23290.1 HK97 family phage prohead protease [Phaeobacter inhibens]